MKVTKLYIAPAVYFSCWPDLSNREQIGMIVRFMTDIPMWQRLKILWYGRVYVQADYRGQHKAMNIQIGAVNPRNLEKENDNNLPN